MKFIDIFSGIGGFRSGLENAGHECIGHIEIDKYANKSYEAIYGGDDLIGTDIRAVTDRRLREFRGECDLVVGGFPCQAFSIAGHQGGFQDTRGTLFFELARVLEQVQPQVLVFENVKNLLSHDKGQTFEVILKTLDELRYDVQWQVLNSKDFGVAQNRERVYIVGFLRGGSRREVFPIRGERKKTFKLQGQSVNTITARYGESRSTGSYVIKNKQLSSKRELRQLVGGAQGQRIYDSGGLSVTLSAQGGGQGAKTGLYAIPILTPDRAVKRQNGRRYKEPNDDMFTLTTQVRHGVILQKGRGKNKGGEKETDPNITSHSGWDNIFLKTHRVRKLTPLECWRLQGFTDEQFYKAKNAGISDSQLYKQAGNAVTVNVIYEIGKRLKWGEEGIL